ncbi:alpha/beta hydrolase [Microbacterium sp. SS28]|uniref:alpha/beta hydrolase n=1 Tax=Microbacterium sp. SS28 TaxID=2919948 RepID=UPI001FAA7365|nr:alpha/beta hydrolase [Microbacterium sp. SS28]
MPEFTDAHGIAIVYDVHPAKREPRGVVQIMHGVGEHSGRYGALIDQLTENGYIVYAGDLRGHGRTGMKQHGDVEKLGRLGPGGVGATLAAVWRIAQIAREENPDLPVVVLGHSGGSFLTQKLINDHSEGFDGFILSGSAYRMPGWLRTGGHNKPWDSNESTGVEWLSSDPAVGAAFLADPLTTDKSPMELFGPVEVAKIFGRPRRNLAHDLPLLLLVGREDTVGGPRSVHKLADAYRARSGLTDITTLVYPGARHEIFNEVMQADVRADVIAWLDKRFPSRD